VTIASDKNIDLYLASESPRRRELLKQIGIRFELISNLDVDESCRDAETPEQYVCRLAKEKARVGYAELDIRTENRKVPVLGADTCIDIGGKTLGKPADREEGIAMLQQLSGHSHQVLTAICLYDGYINLQALSRTTVMFKELELPEIEQYWDSSEPADKAGAYAIQGVAAKFIVDLHGSYSGVVGLPLHELSQLLDEFENQMKWEKKKRV